LAAKLSKSSDERYELCKKSAEAGCSWGQVEYAFYFRHGVKKDEKAYSDQLFQAANHQRNPRAMCEFGDWFHRKKQYDQSLLYYRGAAELGWKAAMKNFSQMLQKGEGGVKDLRRAAFWYAKSGTSGFSVVVRDARIALDGGKTEDLKCDFNQLCYTLGWGHYWHRLFHRYEEKTFVAHCLDYYCSCVELQQKSIFTFLMCWNQTTGGVKGPGQTIAKMVWKGKKNHLLKLFQVYA
jgi:TPR repeat protein